MGLFNKKPVEKNHVAEQKWIEISVEKGANKEMFDKAKTATQYLNDVLQENHIHIKIYSVAGGKTKKRSG